MLGYPQVLAMFHLCIPWDLKVFCSEMILWAGKLPHYIALRDGGYTSTDTAEEFDYEGELFIFKNSLFFKPIK